MSKRNLPRNAALLLSSARQDFTTAPLEFVAQVFRRIPTSSRNSCSSFLKLSRKHSTARALYWLLRDDENSAREALSRVPVRRRGRLFSELAIHLHVPELIQRVKPSRRLTMRSRHYQGDFELPDLPIHRSVRGVNAGEQTPAVFHVLTNSAPHSHGGYAHRSHELLLAQQAAGIRVAAATRLGYPVILGKGNASQVDVVDGIKYFRLLPWRMPKSPAGRVQRGADILQPLVKSFKADVLCTTTDFMNAAVTSEVARRLNIPWTYEVRGLPEDSWRTKFPTAEKRAAAANSLFYRSSQTLETRAAQAAAHVFTLGPPLRADFISRGVKSDDVTVVRNAVSERNAGADTKQPAAAHRSTLGLPESGVWVGSVTSIVSYEGLETLVEAVAFARRHGADARLLLVGDGVTKPSLEKLAHDRGLIRGVHVVFTGRVPRSKTDSYYRALDIFAIPRRDERVCRIVEPLKPLQAVAENRPILSSDLPALRSLLESFNDTQFLPAADTAVWGNALIQRSSEERLPPACEYRVDIMGTVFTWHSQAQHYVDALGALAQRRPDE